MRYLFLLAIESLLFSALIFATMPFLLGLLHKRPLHRHQWLAVFFAIWLTLFLYDLIGWHREASAFIGLFSFGKLYFSSLLLVAVINGATVAIKCLGSSR